MSVARTPRLLFHGTSALSAHLSYRSGRELEAQHKQHPRKTLKMIGRDHLDSYFFKDLGAGYPYAGHSTHMTLRKNICLADSLFMAMNFAHWQIETKMETGLRLVNSLGRNITLHNKTFSNFPGTQAVYLKIAEQAYQTARVNNGTLNTPGTILIVDGPKMAENALLERGRSSEEYGIASYVPWQFVRGALIVEARETGGRGKINSYWFRDQAVARDLRNTIANWHIDDIHIGGQFVKTSVASGVKDQLAL